MGLSRFFIFLYLILSFATPESRAAEQGSCGAVSVASANISVTIPSTLKVVSAVRGGGLVQVKHGAMQVFSNEFEFDLIPVVAAFKNGRRDAVAYQQGAEPARPFVQMARVVLVMPR